MKNIGLIASLTGLISLWGANELTYERKIFNHEGEEYIAFTRGEDLKMRRYAPHICFTRLDGTSEGKFESAQRGAPVRGIGVLTVAKESSDWERCRQKFYDVFESYSSQKEKGQLTKPHTL